MKIVLSLDVVGHKIQHLVHEDLVAVGRLLAPYAVADQAVGMYAVGEDVHPEIGLLGVTGQLFWMMEKWGQESGLAGVRGWLTLVVGWLGYIFLARPLVKIRTRGAHGMRRYPTHRWVDHGWSVGRTNNRRAAITENFDRHQNSCRNIVISRIGTARYQRFKFVAVLRCRGP